MKIHIKRHQRYGHHRKGHHVRGHIRDGRRIPAHHRKGHHVSRHSVIGHYRVM